MKHAAYTLTLPEDDHSLAVFSSPHSGADYPRAFLRDSLLDELTLRSSEDAYVDELFAAAPSLGAPLIAARFPRAYVDLNRSETELDPAVIAMDRRTALNPRLAAGLGVIPRVVAEGRAIRQGKITLAAAEERLATCHRPYHAALSGLLDQTREAHGLAVLFDCHSMPRDALRGLAANGSPRPEIVLGDRFGSACSSWVMGAAVDGFRAAGFRVACNTPFAGGHITQTYGKPEKGLHALQIEIDRSLYMEERTLRKRADFAQVQARITDVISRLVHVRPERFSLAAE
ncbi:N-formylglutamate deformylase [Rubricella aquisinus]|uniref:N-formylglutamate deformylase n=1 Tax=Rubricella aquisinus TaxID=2028108 RepID=A0A840WJ91_9RHOB|nr:N-formylglutamate amidohydrolase [Rubricella aquisinus]MBB5514581.1 N-formylglutamate deformylase [Rubricella aquisinus]